MQAIQKSIDLFLNKIKNKYNISKEEWDVFNKVDVYFCIYEYSYKKKKGEVCGKQIKNGEFCYKHIPKKKVTEKVSKKVVEKVVEKVVKKVTENKQIVIRLYHAIEKYVHLPTRLIFFSKEKRVVYAKVSNMDSIIPLSEEDIETCKAYKFYYDVTLLHLFKDSF